MKGGLIVLRRCMALEFARRAIRVNSVPPGSTCTLSMIPDEVLAKYPDVIVSLVEKTAFGRCGEARHRQA
jgi:NAD(P)-dependent dehydrogenase (short-subunit alcohol dehydrogenase family)